MEAFRSGAAWVLIATDLLGRGIDFKGVATVVNFDFPHSTAAYIHRVGRTGRAGRSGTAITFFTEAEADSLRAVANVMKARWEGGARALWWRQQCMEPRCQGVGKAWPPPVPVGLTG